MASRPKLPEGIMVRLRSVIKDLEAAEEQHLDRTPGGEIEFKINEAEALWYVAYKTDAAAS
ncbi:MAG TPA: hypothetical protein VHU22_19230 [Xanthobacteraceae bacterium]|jgi:hypothetical protein|nr:hypothetical protein [Xanthobacteraceae bacterium]